MKLDQSDVRQYPVWNRTKYNKIHFHMNLNNFFGKFSASTWCHCKIGDIQG